MFTPFARNDKPRERCATLRRGLQGRRETERNRPDKQGKRQAYMATCKFRYRNDRTAVDVRTNKKMSVENTGFREASFSPVLPVDWARLADAALLRGDRTECLRLIGCAYEAADRLEGVRSATSGMQVDAVLVD